MNDFDRSIISAINGMEGWCTEEKALALANLVRNEQPDLVVELGVFGGKSLVPMGLALRANGHGIAYGVDPWSVDAAIEGDVGEANKQWWTQNMNLDSIHTLCMAKIRSLQLEQWVIPIRCKSEHAIQLFPLIDFCHIDGNHSELASVRDVTKYVPMVRTGGIIVFDDADWSSTKKAVSLLEEQAELFEDHQHYRVYFKK